MPNSIVDPVASAMTVHRGRRSRAAWRRRCSAFLLVAVLAPLVAAAGCSDQVDVGVDGVDARWIDVPGTDGRQALLVTDDSERVRSSAGRPLIVVLHGLGQDAEHMAGIGGWPALARDKRAVVAFGEGSDNSWNAGTCCGQAAADGVDDVAYLNSLIDEVVRTTGADRAAVYMVGFSNGAMMTYRYLCEGKVSVRGAASLAGTDVDGCTPSRPTNFLQISGSADTVVPIGNTASVAAELGPLMPVGAAVTGVAAGFDCPKPTTTSAAPVTRMTWAPCRDGVTVRFDEIAGLGHSYPIVDGYQGTDEILSTWGFPAAPAPTSSGPG